MEKQKLPHSQAALILGIVSIVTACCCYGLPGVILGFIGINEAKKAKATHEENPDMYTGLNNAETGRITSIIGIVIGALAVLWLIYAISSGKYGEMMEQYKEAIEQAQ
jgi:hypothetical protein